jgi:glycogen synthase
VAEGCDGDTVQNILQLCLQRASALLPSVLYEHASAPKDFAAPTGERINAYLSLLSTVSSSPELLSMTRILVKKSAKIGPIVFLSAELGRFSTAGGLGVMVDELTKGLVVLGLEVYVVSPYYAVNRKNEPDYLGPNITWTRNLLINVGSALVDVGVFEGVEEGVKLIFLERKDFFTKVYANPGSAVRHLQCIVLMSLGSLEIFCQKAVKPSMVVTNDWLPSMAAGYARNGHFGDFFNQTSFMHLIHNLGDTTYEGRCFPEVEGDDMGYIHRLPRHLVVDPLWSRTICNPSRTALLCSDSWGTVSPSYMKELLSGHDLSPLLQIARRPFAYPNGIPKAARELLLLTKGALDHPTAKALLQSRYFGMERPDPSVPLFAFVGRVTAQKGVHLILNAVEALIRHTDGKIQILVGGPANYQDPYAAGCAHHMHGLRYAHPKCFWAAPDEFFTDGPLVNLGADFGIMPSLFEPGGIVQQEFFVAGTPVVAFKTGGLKDTVHEWQIDESEGNGFLFEDYNHEDFVMAMKRALRVFSTPAEYMALRRFAYMTTIDVSQVAWAWSSEFHRMRNAIYSREDVLHAEYSSRMRIEESKATSSGVLDASARVVDLCWSTAVGSGDSVFVKGSWDDWAAEYKLKPVAASGAVHVTQLLLPRGEYVYKFRVGSTWSHASDHPMRAAASTGNLMNNVLVVE